MRLAGCSNRAEATKQIISFNQLTNLLSWWRNELSLWMEPLTPPQFINSNHPSTSFKSKTFDLICWWSELLCWLNYCGDIITVNKGLLFIKYVNAISITFRIIKRFNFIYRILVLLKYLIIFRYLVDALVSSEESN